VCFPDGEHATGFQSLSESKFFQGVDWRTVIFLVFIKCFELLVFHQLSEFLRPNLFEISPSKTENICKLSKTKHAYKNGGMLKFEIASLVHTA